MSDDRESVQNSEDAGPKLYRPNQMVNFRLTKERDDIRRILNEKRKQGIDISNYLAQIIRQAEGLPDPFPNNSLSFKLSDDQMEELANRIMAQIVKSGMLVPPTGTAATFAMDNKADDEAAKKAELKKLADDLMEW